MGFVTCLLMCALVLNENSVSDLSQTAALLPDNVSIPLSMMSVCVPALKWRQHLKDCWVHWGYGQTCLDKVSDLSLRVLYGCTSRPLWPNSESISSIFHRLGTTMSCTSCYLVEDTRWCLSSWCTLFKSGTLIWMYLLWAVMWEARNFPHHPCCGLVMCGHGYHTLEWWWHCGSCSQMDWQSASQQSAPLGEPVCSGSWVALDSFL